MGIVMINLGAAANGIYCADEQISLFDGGMHGEE